MQKNFEAVLQRYLLHHLQLPADEKTTEYKLQCDADANVKAFGDLVDWGNQIWHETKVADLMNQVPGQLYVYRGIYDSNSQSSTTPQLRFQGDILFRGQNNVAQRKTTWGFFKQHMGKLQMEAAAYQLECDTDQNGLPIYASMKMYHLDKTSLEKLTELHKPEQSFFTCGRGRKVTFGKPLRMQGGTAAANNPKRTARQRKRKHSKAPLELRSHNVPVSNKRVKYWTRGASDAAIDGRGCEEIYTPWIANTQDLAVMSDDNMSVSSQSVVLDTQEAEQLEVLMQ